MRKPKPRASAGCRRRRWTPVDVAAVGVSGAPPELNVRLKHFEAIPREEAVREGIFRLLRSETSSVVDICDMNIVLGHVFADAVLRTLRRADIASEIAFISSHGQTLSPSGSDAYRHV